MAQGSLLQRILDSTFNDFTESLGSLNLALDLVGRTAQGIISPFMNAVNQAEEFNQQILQAQIAFNVATKEFNAFGEQVVSFADRMQSSRDKFKKLSEEIEIETQTVVGLTSSRLNNVLNEIIQESSTILNQFTDKYGKNATDIFKKLTGNLSATYSLLGSPEFQDPQETRSLLIGNVNDPNSFVAQKLNISQAEAAEAQSQGRYIDLLIEKTQAYREASTLASDSLKNITSNLDEMSQLIARAFGEPLLASFSKLGGELFSAISTTQNNSIENIKISSAKAVLAIDKEINTTRNKLQFAGSEEETKTLSQSLTNLVSQREDIVKQATKKAEGLGVKDAENVIKSYFGENLSLAGRESFLSTKESEFIPEKTNLEKITDLATDFGERVGEIFESLFDALNKIGEILESLNINEFLEGFGTGFIEGLTGTINGIINAINSVFDAINPIIEGFGAVLRPFIDIDSGNILGIIAGAASALALLSTITGGVTTGFRILFRETQILAGAMRLASRTGIAGGVRGAAVDVGQIAADAQFRSFVNRRFAPNALSATRTGGAFVTAGNILGTGLGAARNAGGSGTIGIIGKVSIAFKSILASITSLLPLFGTAIAVVGATFLLFKGLNIVLQKFTGNGGLFGRFARGLQGVIEKLDIISKIQLDRKEAQEIVVNNILGQLDSSQAVVSAESRGILSQEDFNRMGYTSEGQKSREAVIARYSELRNNLSSLLSEDFDTLQESMGLDDFQIDQLKKALRGDKGKEIKKELQDNIDELDKDFEQRTGRTLENTQEALGTPFRGSFTQTSFSNLAKLKDFTDPSRTSGLSAEMMPEMIENISKSFEQLMDNDLLGTEALNLYMKDFQEILSNEYLTAEQRTQFITLYNKAIQKELEITNRFLEATKTIIDYRERAGIITKETADTERLQNELDKITAELTSEIKKSKIGETLREEMTKEAQNEIKQREVKLKESGDTSKVVDLQKKISPLEEKKRKLEEKQLDSNAIKSLQDKANKIFFKSKQKVFVDKDGIARDTKTETKFTLSRKYAQSEINSIIRESKLEGDEAKKLKDYLEFINDITKVDTNRFGMERREGFESWRESNKIGRDKGSLAKSLLIGSTGTSGMAEFFKRNSKAIINSNYYQGIEKSSPEAKAYIDKFLNGFEISDEEFSKISQENIKKINEFFISTFETLGNDKNALAIKLSPYLDKTTAIENLRKDIENLDAELQQEIAKVVIKTDVDDKDATEKLKKLKADREVVSKRLTSTEGTKTDDVKLQELDRAIDLESTIINIGKYKNSIEELKKSLASTTDTTKKNEIQSEIDSQSALLKILEERKNKIEELNKNESELAKKKEQLKEFSGKTEEEMSAEEAEKFKKLQGEISNLEKNRSDIMKTINTDDRTEVELVAAKLDGNAELNKLSAGEIDAKVEGYLTLLKELEVQKLISEELKLSARYRLEAAQAAEKLAKTQLLGLGTFQSDLFKPDVIESQIDEAIVAYKNSKNELAKTDKTLDNTFKEAGGGRLADIYKLSQTENGITKGALINQVNRTANKDFKEFEEAYKFLQDSVNMSTNANRILNATDITDEVKNAYKYIYKQDIPQGRSLEDIQTLLKNTIGAASTGNEEAFGIGEILGSLKIGDLGFSQAIEESKKLGINVEGIKNTQELINQLTIEYGEALGTNEINAAMEERAKASAEVSKSEAQVLGLMEQQIGALIEQKLLIDRRLSNEKEIADYISKYSGELSNSQFELNRAVDNYKNAVKDLNLSLELRNPEEIQKLLKEKNLPISIEGIEKLKEIGGISDELANKYKAVFESFDKVIEASMARLDSFFEKRNKSIEALNTLGSFNIGPNMGMSEQEKNLLSLSTNTEQAFSRLSAAIDLQKAQQQFVGVTDGAIDFTDVLDEIGMAANAAKAQLDGITTLSVSKFEEANQKASRQLQIIQSMQQAYASLSNATDIYYGIVTKLANTELSSLQEQLQKVPVNQEAIREYEELKEQSSKRFGGPSFAQKLKMEELYKETGLSERERIEKKIQELKDKQLEIEKIQAEIALKRQEIENKILQLKNKQARIELFAERARIIGMEDSPQKQMMLESNSQLLKMNALEGEYLQKAGSLITNASRLQKAINNDNGPGATTELEKAKGLYKGTLSDLGSLDKEINSLMSTFGMSDFEAMSNLQNQEELSNKLKESLAELIPQEAINQIKEQLLKTPPDIIQGIDGIITKNNISSSLKGIESNTAKISSQIGANKPQSPSQQQQPPSPPAQPSSKANNVQKQPSSNDILSQQKAQTNGDYVFGYNSKGEPIISNRKAMESTFMNPGITKEIGSFSVDSNTFGSVSSGKGFREFLGMGDQEEKIQQEINKRKVDRQNEIRKESLESAINDMMVRTFFSPSLLPSLPTLNNLQVPTAPNRNNSQLLETFMGGQNTPNGSSNQYKFDGRDLNGQRPLYSGTSDKTELSNNLDKISNQVSSIESTIENFPTPFTQEFQNQQEAVKYFSNPQDLNINIEDRLNRTEPTNIVENNQNIYNQEDNNTYNNQYESYSTLNKREDYYNLTNQNSTSYNSNLENNINENYRTDYYNNNNLSYNTNQNNTAYNSNLENNINENYRTDYNNLTNQNSTAYYNNERLEQTNINNTNTSTTAQSFAIEPMIEAIKSLGVIFENGFSKLNTANNISISGGGLIVNSTPNYSNILNNDSSSISESITASAYRNANG